MSSTTQLYLKPAVQLKDIIDHYWFVEVNEGNSQLKTSNSQIHLPTSCVDWYFNYNDSTCDYWFENQYFRVGCNNSILVGIRNMDKVLRSSMFKTPFKGMRIRFTIHGFYKLFLIPTNELYNNVYFAEDVIGSEIRSLHDKMEIAKNHEERKFYLDEYFIYRINKYSRKSITIDNIVNSINTIKVNNGNIKLPALLKQSCKSERSFERDIKLVVGITPKELCQTFRVQNVIRALNLSTNVDWQQLVIDNGYYDQAHLINEFKKVTSISPNCFVKNKNKEFTVAISFLVFLTDEYLKELVNKAIVNYKTFSPDKNSIVNYSN